MATSNSASKAAFEAGVNNFIAAPSDLVPGVYEGGLKTWECSLDLIAYMESQGTSEITGKSVLEVCAFADKSATPCLETLTSDFCCGNLDRS